MSKLVLAHSPNRNTRPVAGIVVLAEMMIELLPKVIGALVYRLFVGFVLYRCMIGTAAYHCPDSKARNYEEGGPLPSGFQPSTTSIIIWPRENYSGEENGDEECIHHKSENSQRQE